MKYEAIEAYSNQFEVKKMCKCLGLQPANYYRWKRNQKEKNKKRFDELKEIKLIEKVFEDSKRTYGYRKIWEALRQNGYEISLYRIRRIMRENGFYPETQKKYKPSRKGEVSGKYYKNIVKQNFKTEKKNQLWTGDITYIKTTVGWVYLAVVIDLYNREVIGYEISKKIDTELVKRALGNAIARNGVSKNLIFHSDRGCQYASKGFQRMLEENGITGSMSRPGCPYDNSCTESFFATLKKEQIYRTKYDTMESVKKDMFGYIELFYNRKRMHSMLGYLSPVAYRLKYDGVGVA